MIFTEAQSHIWPDVKGLISPKGHPRAEGFFLQRCGSAFFFAKAWLADCRSWNASNAASNSTGWSCNVSSAANYKTCWSWSASSAVNYNTSWSWNISNAENNSTCWSCNVSSAANYKTCWSWSASSAVNYNICRFLDN